MTTTWPPEVPLGDWDNDTVNQDRHPAEHNKIAVAIQALIERMDAAPGGGYTAEQADARFAKLGPDGRVLDAGGRPLIAEADADAVYAPIADANLTGTVKVNGETVPAHLVAANVAGVQMVVSNTDPGPLTGNQFWVGPADTYFRKPTPAPSTESVPTVKSDGTQGLVAVGALGGGGTGGSATVAGTARRILSGAASQRLVDVQAVHPNPPTVTITATATSSITGAVRVPFKRKTSTLIDVRADPNFDYPGARTDHLPVFNTTYGYADYLTEGNAQNRRDYWRPRSVHTGAVMEWIVQPTTTTLRYRVWVDGMPLALEFTNFTAAAAGTTHLIKLDFTATSGTAPKIVELEVNDPRIGGAWIEPTGSLTRVKTARPVGMVFGDSHTSAAAGVSLGDAWPAFASRALALDPVNVGIGGSGFLTATAPYRNRLAADVIAQNPDLLVIEGGYNDTTAAAADITAEARYVLATARAGLPAAAIVLVGPWQPSQTVAASLSATDAALRAAADAEGVPYVSLVDPLNLKASAPAWAASTVYAIGDVVVSGNIAWKARVAHTSGTTFAAANWLAQSFVTGTGRAGTPTGDGNADAFVASDGIHASLLGHRAKAYFLTAELSRALRVLAGVAA